MDRVHTDITDVIDALAAEGGVTLSCDDPNTSRYGWVSKKGHRHYISAGAPSTWMFRTSAEARKVFLTVVNVRAQATKVPLSAWDRLLEDD